MLARGVSLASRRVLRIAGEDAVPFLQRILTNDVRSLAEAGAAPVYAALQNAQGRVRHDLFLHREFGGALLADLPADGGAAASVAGLSDTKNTTRHSAACFAAMRTASRTA